MEVDISVDNNKNNSTTGLQKQIGSGQRPDKFEQCIEDAETLRFQRVPQNFQEFRRPFKIEARDIILKNFQEA